MSEANITEQPQEIKLQTDVEMLTDELREKIRTSNIHDNYVMAEETRKNLRELLAKGKYENGQYSFEGIEGLSDSEAYDLAQKYQAVFMEIVDANNKKLMSTNLMNTSQSLIPGTPSMQKFDAVHNGMVNDVFDRFEKIHGLEIDKIFQPYKFMASKATIDDFLMTGESNTRGYGYGNPPQNVGDYAIAGANQATQVGSPTRVGTQTGVAPGYNIYGVPVDRYLSQIPAQMHLRKRDYLTPMIQRIPCPPVTDTLRYISEELASGAPGSSNKVGGTPEGARALFQNMNTREIRVTVVKRALAASITKEQTTDTIQARQILHDNMLIKMQEDFEDQIVNGDGTGDNMSGIFHRGSAPTGDLRHLDAAHPWFKQTFARGAGEPRTPLDFFLQALTQYLKPRPDGSDTFGSGNEAIAAPGNDYGAGRSPTHIVLPLAEKMRLMGEKDNQGRYLWANTVEGDFISLWGMPIITSDFMPNGKGLILALDELAIVVKQGIEWDFGLTGDDLIRGQTTMVATHRANLLVKRPRSVMILENLAAA